MVGFVAELVKTMVDSTLLEELNKQSWLYSK